jgi:hypothetical protein
MLKHNEVNPLNVFGLRRMDHCPPHFETLCFDLKTQEKNIADWIYENLSSRFFFGDTYIINPENGNMILCHKVAFEDASELSYFGMFLDTINVYDYTPK